MTNGFEGPRNTNSNNTSHDIPDIHQEGVTDPQAQPIREHEVDAYADQLGAAPSGIPPKGERDSDRTAKKEKKSHKKGIIGTIGGVATAAVAAGAVLLSQGGNSTEADHNPGQVDPTQHHSAAPVIPGPRSPEATKTTGGETDTNAGLATAPDKYTGRSFKELDALAEHPDQFITNASLQEKLFWQSKYLNDDGIDGLKQAMISNIDPAQLPHVKLNVNPSAKDSPQKIVDGFSADEEMMSLGFGHDVQIDAATTQTQNDMNKGASYFSTDWLMKGKNGDDMKRRFNNYKEGAFNQVKKNDGQMIPDDENIVVQGKSTEGTMHIDGIGKVKTVTSSEIDGSGYEFTSTYALVPYINSDNQPANKWLVTAVTNKN